MNRRQREAIAACEGAFRHGFVVAAITGRADDTVHHEVDYRGNYAELVFLASFAQDEILRHIRRKKPPR